MLFYIVVYFAFAYGCGNIIPVVASDNVGQNFLMFILKELGIRCSCKNVLRVAFIDGWQFTVYLLKQNI